VNTLVQGRLSLSCAPRERLPRWKGEVRCFGGQRKKAVADLEPGGGGGGDAPEAKAGAARCRGVRRIARHADPTGTRIGIRTDLRHEAQRCDLAFATR